MNSSLLPIIPAVDDILFNFAQSDGLSQANQVDSARNQGLTAPELNTVVFLDAGVTDYQSLQAGVIPGVATVILSPNKDGIEQITAFLQQNPQITTIHLVSHGAPGCLYLGNCQLNLTNIYDYRQQLQNWAKINRILLAASSGRVGNAALGGSWDLEVIVSPSESEQDLNISLAFVGETLATYEGVFALSLVSNYDTRHATDLHIVENYAYVANWTGGWSSIIKIIDISNPINPILKGNYTSSPIASDVQIVGNYAYVVSGDPATLQITDISNPADPTFKSAITFYQDVPNDVEVVGNLAYVACNVSGLHIIDISNPTNPTHKANYRTGDLYSGYALGVQVVGKYAYVAAFDLGLEIIDISNPTAPTLKGKYDTLGIADDVQIVGNYAYLADRGSGLQIIDISNPSNPTLKGSYKTSYSAQSVQVVDKYAYVAVGYLGLEIIDISNPTNPTLKGNYDTDGWVSDVQVVGNYAYVADGDGGLKIIDVSEFTTPATTVTLAVSPTSVTEDGTANLVYTFTRSGVTTNALTVNYTVGGTATNGTDYTSIPTSVTFAANSATATLIVDPTADTLNDDLPSITLAVSPSSVTEDGTANLVYTFTRSGVTTNALTVNYTVGGTATNGTDYTSIPTSVTFAANSSTATVTVDPTADTTVEPDETVALTLATGTGYTVGTTTAVTGTILNDDTSVTLAVSPSSVTEDGTANLVYTFTRSGVTTNALTVNYTIGGTATNGTDYTSIPTSVTFAANSATALRLGQVIQ